MIDEIKIRKGKLDDLIEIQLIFVETVSTICQKDYSRNQIKAWISSVENRKRWLNIIENQYLIIAKYKNQIVGFCSLDKSNYIDMFYVHKDYQGRGIAQKLYSEIEKEARRQNQKKLTSDVSKTAKPFFEKNDFKIVKEQAVIRQNIKLTNFKMEKNI